MAGLSPNWNADSKGRAWNILRQTLVVVQFGNPQARQYIEFGDNYVGYCKAWTSAKRGTDRETGY